MIVTHRRARTLALLRIPYCFINPLQSLDSHSGLSPGETAPSDTAGKVEKVGPIGRVSMSIMVLAEAQVAGRSEWFPWLETSQFQAPSSPGAGRPARPTPQP